MTAPAEIPAAEGRKGDGVLVMIQNNEQKRLFVRSANETLANLLGYADGELADREVGPLFGTRVAKLLEDDLEFTADAPDAGEILSRQREFRLRHRLGQEIATNVKITRLMSEGQQACFQLVFPNEREQLAQQKVKDFLKLNLEGRQQLEPHSGLPDHATAETYLGLLRNYLASNGVEASFAVIRLDRHEKSLARYGQKSCWELLQHVGNVCRTTFRTEDVIFALSDHTLGLILFDISRESVRVVLNRLRWNIRNHRIDFGGKSDFSITVSIAFDMLDEGRGDTLLDRCEEAAYALDKDARNSLIELGP